MKVVGIGIDAVSIHRFEHWSSYKKTTLLRIFSPEELDNCLAVPIKSAERFAARFAAREALFKALSQARCPVSFSVLCKTISIRVTRFGPLVVCSKNIFSGRILLTISHTEDIAIALVMLQAV
jgi:phosphopantetheine--protein transferase-like protein